MRTSLCFAEVVTKQSLMLAKKKEVFVQNNFS